MNTKYILVMITALAICVVGCKTTQQSPQPPQQPPAAKSSKPASASTASSSSSRSQPSSASQSARKNGSKASSTSGKTAKNRPSSSQQSTSKSSDKGSSLPSNQQGEGSEGEEQYTEAKNQQNGGNGDEKHENLENISGESSTNPSDEIDFSEEENSASSAQAEQSEKSAQNTQNNSSANDSSQSADSSAGSTTSGQSQAEVALTRSERVGELDEQLDRSMGDYDGMILTEREYIQNRGNEEGSEQEVEVADVGTLYDDVLNGEAESSNQQASNKPGNSSSSGVGNMPTVSSNDKDGDFKHKQTVYAPPADISSGNDDDVVARQIREAALNEADPVLREKLWQEYRKYKKANN